MTPKFASIAEQCPLRRGNIEPEAQNVKHNVAIVFSKTLSAVFDAQCSAHPERLAYVFLRDDLSVAEQLSHGALAREAAALAQGLAAIARPGDRVL